MKIRVGVLFGAKSVEHEVSIITAVQAMNYMNTDKYEIVPIYISKDLEMYTGNILIDIDSYKDFNLIKKYCKKVNLINKKGNFILQSTKWFKRKIDEIDIAFPIVHGANCEDGTIQGYLETLGIPYVGSNVVSSAIGQDKVFMKQVFASNDIPIKKYIWFNDFEYLEDKENLYKKINELKYPLIIKPATLGSSIGINIVNDISNLDNAIEEAICYDTKVVIEEVVTNLIEVNCAVLGNASNMQVSTVEEVIASDKILSYNDKYVGEVKGSTKGMLSSRRIMPARIDKKIYNEVLDLSKKVFKCLNNKGVARIDFLIDSKSKKIYVNEINTIPGCLAFYLFEQLEYSKILDIMINDAIKNYKKRKNITYTFSNNILSNMGSKSLKRGVKK